MPALPLYISPSLAPQPTPSTISSILSDIRSTRYIGEVTSNEVPPEESGLWNTVIHVSLPDGHDGSDQGLKEFTESNSKNSNDVELAHDAYVLVDERTINGDGSLVVVDYADEEVESLRVARGSVIEVACNIAIANMSLSDYKEMCGGAEVFDAGQ